MTSSPRRRGKFRRKLTVLTLGLTIVPAIALAWTLLAIYRRSLEESYSQRLYTVASDLAHTAEAEIRGARQQLEVIASFLADGDRPAAERIARTRIAMSSALAFSRAQIYDENGEPIDSLMKGAEERETPVPPRLTAELRAAVRDQGYAVTPLLRQDGGTWLPLILPVRGTAFTWYVCAPLPLDELDRRANDLILTLEHQIAVVVLDRALEPVAEAGAVRPGDEQMQALGLAANFPVLTGNRMLVVKRYRARGQEYMAAVSGMADLPLLFVAQLPAAVVEQQLSRVRLAILGAIALAAALSIAIGLWFARTLAAPVHKLVSYAETLGKRQFDRPMELSSNDELEVLADAMSASARSLAASEARLQEEAAIRADLGRYLPQQLVDRVARREQELDLGGQSRVVTVMFADIAGFTELVKTQKPEVVGKILNELFTILTEIVFRYGGTIDKFIGDCVMAFWNAPGDQADHARRAMSCAEDMMAWLEVGNRGWGERFGIHIELAIGINTGTVLVGNFGSKTRMEYTCIGETVNLAARLEHLARPQQILITRATQEAAGPEFETHSLGLHTIAGMPAAVEVVEVLA
ncbi:MAG: adenylate/guanylate cyclase domain-containing protein [Myxococcales bacterium]|nr:adenylate/guanylate cyclase domain-containing protein [Myxococcales bacterium]